MKPMRTTNHQTLLKAIPLTLLVGLSLVAKPLFAQEILTIESTITGSQEQPKVISIVPWKEPKDPEYFGKDIQGLNKSLNDFEPLYRQSFQGEYKYIHSLKEINK
jgi:hypothetical protein